MMTEILRGRFPNAVDVIDRYRRISRDDEDVERRVHDALLELGAAAGVLEYVGKPRKDIMRMRGLLEDELVDISKGGGD